LASLYNNRFDTGTFFNGDGAHTLFNLGYARGIWVGGYDPNGNFKMAASTYAQGNQTDFGCGPVYFGLEDREERCAFFTRAWKVTKTEVEQMRSDFLSGELDINEIPTDILEWPAIGNPHITVLDIEYEMAPFHDNDGDGVYDPMKGDYPVPLKESTEFVPHQFRFYVMNDNELHRATFGDPLQMEFHVTDYVVACDEESESEKSVFTRITYINQANEDIRNFKFGIWDDTDLGYSFNDYLGCSQELNCSYVYNANGVDSLSIGGFPSVPSSLGSVRSLILMSNELESFIYYNNAGVVNAHPATVDPSFANNYYNYMEGYWLDGTPMTVGGNGYNPGSTDTTNFAFPDFPTDPNGWSMEQENLPLGDIRSVSTVATNKIVVPGQRGTIDLIDHMLIDTENLGLDIFNIYEEKINEVKSEYNAMTEGRFLACGNILSSNKEVSVSDEGFNVFPNPSLDYINLAFQEEVSGKLNIYSTTGSLISEQAIAMDQQLRLDVSSFPSGLYVAVFYDEKGEVSNSYFIKE